MKKKEVICPIEFDESLRKKSAEFSVPGKPRGKERPRVETNLEKMKHRVSNFMGDVKDKIDDIF